MLRAILKKRAQVLVTILVLSVLFTTVIPLIASAKKGGGGNGGGKTDTGFIEKWIGPEGGYIQIDDEICLVIPAGALKDGTEIGARMKRDKKNKKTKFYFSPAGLDFHRPAELQATWEAIRDSEEEEPGLQYAVEIDRTIYDIGDPTKSKIEEWGVIWKIKHFSLYYYRRR